MVSTSASAGAAGVSQDHRPRQAPRLPADRKETVRLLKAWGFLRTGRKPHPKAQGKRFDITASNRLGQTDMTGIWCGDDGWGYFTTVIDTFDRVLLGRSFTLRCRALDVSLSLEIAWSTAFRHGADPASQHGRPTAFVEHGNGGAGSVHPVHPAPLPRR